MLQLFLIINPSLQAQFSMNQTRAEEITMREDYGNINLETEDNGFGDGTNAPGTPEMLRENDEFNPENMSLAPPEVSYFTIPLSIFWKIFHKSVLLVRFPRRKSKGFLDNQ